MFAGPCRFDTQVRVGVNMRTDVDSIDSVVGEEFSYVPGVVRAAVLMEKGSRAILIPVGIASQADSLHGTKARGVLRGDCTAPDDTNRYHAQNSSREEDTLTDWSSVGTEPVRYRHHPRKLT
jgi:hypothetical protein